MQAADDDNEDASEGAIEAERPTSRTNLKLGGKGAPWGTMALMVSLHSALAQALQTSACCHTAQVTALFQASGLRSIDGNMLAFLAPEVMGVHSCLLSDLVHLELNSVLPFQQAWRHSTL